MCSLLTEYDEEKTLAMMREEMKEIAKEELRETVEEEVREEITEKVKEEVREEVTEKVKEEVREEVTEKVKEEVLQILVKDNIAEGKTKEQIIDKLTRLFSMSREEAEPYYNCSQAALKKSKKS